MSPVLPYLRNIEAASCRAAELCRQMLAYSGRGSFVVEALDLSEVVREITHMLEVSISKKARLRYDLADGLPAVEADADPDPAGGDEPDHQRLRGDRRPQRRDHRLDRDRGLRPRRPRRDRGRRRAARGSLRRARGRRHRVRDDGGGPAPGLRPVLHHQVHGPGPRAWPRCSASCAVTAGRSGSRASPAGEPAVRVLLPALPRRAARARERRSRPRRRLGRRHRAGGGRRRRTSDR